ncbi:MAG: hypothetical protein RL021_2157 [Bacteroidota bacterium]|jgi:glutamyl-tRNA synthetase
MGGVRTALYNYLFAKKHGGDFLLRIEDTDQQRFVPGAEEYIIESLKWCGIHPDEGVGFGNGPHAPYRQSERKEIYRRYAEQLVESGHAYYAFDRTEDLDALRKSSESSGSAFSYNASTRLNLVNSLILTEDETRHRIAEGEHFVVRLKVPANETVLVSDVIRGDVQFDSNQLDDKVLYKSDGMPTYHLANVVDDYLMKITHVIRGEEWLPSSPLHVLLYRYLGWESVMPRFAHLPLLLKPDGNGKLSKRDGDRLGFPVFPLNWTDPFTGEISSGYRERGYYPEAFVNVLALLGWHPSDDREIFSIQELVEEFSLERVAKSGAKFDPEKTKWFNEHYLRTKSDEELGHALKASAQKRFGFESGDRRLSDEFTVAAARLLKERVQFESELVEAGAYLFVSPEKYDESVIAKRWKPELSSVFEALIDAYGNMESFNEQSAEEVFKSVAAHFQKKPGDLLQLLRVLVSGQAGGVHLFSMIGLLGRQEVVDRMNRALTTLKTTA